MQMMFSGPGRIFLITFARHAPWKQVRIRNTSAPWISDEIRYEMNRPYKLFKKAVNTKCPLLWQEYKRARNEVTSTLRLAKASYSSKMFDEVKNTTIYWKLLKKATNPTQPKTIGPLKREDDIILHCSTRRKLLCSTIGENVADKLPPPPSAIEYRETEAIRNLSAKTPPLSKITYLRDHQSRIAENKQVNWP